MQAVAQRSAQPPREYTVSHWGLEQGLPQSSVNSIVQTRDGYLWLATFGGLVRFDGVRFTVFDRANTPALESDRCVSLYEDRSGRLWILTENGLAIYQGGTFTFLDGVAGLPGAQINCVIEDPLDSVWAGTTANALFRFDGVRFDSGTRIEIRGQLAVRARPGETIIATVDTVWSLDGRTLNPVYTFPRRWPARIVNAEWSADGALLMTTNGTGLLRLQDGRVSVQTTKNGLVSDHLTAIMRSRDGSIWLGSVGGVTHMRPDGYRSQTSVDGLTDNVVSSILEDREGNIWLGTSTGGLNRIRRVLFTTFGIEQGIGEDKVLSIAPRSDGSLVFGSNCGGVHEFRNERVFDSPMSRFLRNDCVWTVFEDRSGTVWIGSDELRGIHDDRLIATYPIPGPMAQYQSPDGIHWAGSHEGLYWRRGTAFERHPQSRLLPNSDVRSLFMDRTGALWIGTVNGLARLRGDSLESITSIPGLRSHYIRAIHQDSSGSLWFGSYGGGLIRYRNGSFVVLTTKNGLFDDIVSTLVEDRFGYFWMGSNRGIARVSIAELDAVAEGRAAFVRSRSFGTADGMESVETNGGFQPSAVTLKDGRIAFPTVDGLSIVDPAKIPAANEPPPVVIERVELNGTVLSPDSMSIEYGDANLAIFYTALTLVEPTKTLFRYRIEGYNDDWVDARGRRTAYYTKLPPGKHTFRVIAANAHGIWNEKGTSLSFEVIPPFWLTTWFRGLLVAIFVLAGPGLYFWRVRTLTRQKQEQQEFARKVLDSQEGERRRIAAELHDGLGQELLIVKNRAALALQRPDDAEQMADQLRQIAGGTGALLEEVRSIAHNLRPAHLERFGLTDTLQSMIEQVSSSTDIKWACRIDAIDGLFAADEEISVYRMVQEGVNNVLKHSGAASASIVIRHAGEVVEMLITDDGRGFDRSRIQSSGMGLPGMLERAHLLGGTAEFEARESGGMAVRFVLPVRKNDRV